MNCNSSKEINWNHPLFTCVISQRLSYICFSFLLFWQKFAESYIWKKENIWNASHHEIKASHLRFPITWCTHSTVSQSVLSHSRYKLCAGWPGKPFMLHLAFHIELYRPYTVKDYIHTIVTFSLEMNVPWSKQ